MQLLFASSNPHKVREVGAIMRGLDIDVIGLDAIGHAGPEPVEDAETFAENARIKAVHYAKVAGRWCLADDSGLAVDALGGKPGVRSARYAGTGATRTEQDKANNALLLRELERVALPDRTARFVCAMCLADPSGTVAAETTGTFEGVITMTPRGDNGFGYDPLFELPALGCTSAELPPEKKNALSHRGDAARRMAELLKTILTPAGDDLRPQQS